MNGLRMNHQTHRSHHLIKSRREDPASDLPRKIRGRANKAIIRRQHHASVISKHVPVLAEVPLEVRCSHLTAIRDRLCIRIDGERDLNTLVRLGSACFPKVKAAGSDVEEHGRRCVVVPAVFDECRVDCETALLLGPAGAVEEVEAATRHCE